MNSIPKRIHYCWFGKGALPELYARCIESWKRLMPDYEIVRWDEESTDLSAGILVDLLRKRQWAFVSDYVRLQVLHEFGGIYLDTDIEVVRSFDPLLVDGGCFLGYESAGRLNTSVIGSVPLHPYVEACMALMRERHAKRKPYLIAPEVASLVAASFQNDHSLQRLDTSYFYPYNPYDRDRPVGTLMYSDVRDNTYAIHHWGKAWRQSLWQRIAKKVL